METCPSGSGGGGWIPLVTRGWPPTSSPGTSGCARMSTRPKHSQTFRPQPRHPGKTAVVGGGFELGQRLDPQVLVDAVRRLRANTGSVANKCSGPDWPRRRKSSSSLPVRANRSMERQREAPMSGRQVSPATASCRGPGGGAGGSPGRRCGRRGPGRRWRAGPPAGPPLRPGAARPARCRVAGPDRCLVASVQP